MGGGLACGIVLVVRCILLCIDFFALLWCFLRDLLLLLGVVFICYGGQGPKSGATRGSRARVVDNNMMCCMWGWCLQGEYTVVKYAHG